MDNGENKEAIDLHIKTEKDHLNENYYCELPIKTIQKYEIKIEGDNVIEATAIVQDNEEDNVDGEVLEEEGFECDECEEIFACEQTLSQHKTTRHSELSCKSCERSFGSVKNLHIHKARCAGKRKHECKVCSKVFQYESILKVHEKMHANGKKTFTCDICDKRFFVEARFLQHKHKPDKHVKREPVCDICGKVFAGRKQLQRHISVVHAGVKRHECSICSKRFSSLYNLRTHMHVHTGEEKRFKCDICGKSFHALSMVKKHYGVHTGERPYMCAVCSKGFFNRSDLERHNRIDHTEKIYKCDICGVELNTKHDLKIHISSTHNELLPYQCETCLKVCANNVLLKKHRRIHSMSKAFTCDICDQVFVIEWQFRKHLRFHERPVYCKICGKEITSHNLDRHMKTHIDGAKSYDCEQCGRTFQRPSRLQTHVSRVHERKKLITPSSSGASQGSA
ncbi:zinc finger protein 227-like [Wyeomyia smithii]|uniref:zinc finger protein 227-like n=1 Tax=Wyeomyia smithii TaxID=174621 RepID=UPI002467F10C|nr:zinc finger protein 227-like [Wyeomyia smithii]